MVWSSMTDPVESQIDEAFRAPISGWDFHWLEGRAQETKPLWNFREVVRDAASEAARMLDIDTGGGEFLASLAPFTAQVVATEGYSPNAPVARGRLRALGIPLVQAASALDNVDQAGTSAEAEGSTLPFIAESFDLVVNRHASYWPSEVQRVLTEAGRFLTQQRSEAGTDGFSWAQLFGRAPHPHARFTLSFAAQQLENAGFVIARAEEVDTPMVFLDLAGMVYYLRIVPWAVQHFDPAADRDSLARIHERIRIDGELQIRGSHMLISARSI
jgi:hypothetical protein